MMQHYNSSQWVQNLLCWWLLSWRGQWSSDLEQRVNEWMMMPVYRGISYFKKLCSQPLHTVSSVHHLFINTHFVSKCTDRNKLLKAMTSERVVLWVFGWQVVLAFMWSLYILMYLFMLGVTHRLMLFWRCSLGSMVELREVIKQPWLLTSLLPFFKADISIVWGEANMALTKVGWDTDKAILSQSFI